MQFYISEELRSLADVFMKYKVKLYIVGGYIRNKILGIPDIYNKDIDLCSSAKPEEIEKILNNTPYKVSNINNEFGVIKIIGKEKVYDHATFRTEKYEFAGSHNPSNVEFIKRLDIDALRRDFKCNAIYYDIYNDEIIDPVDGVKDIKNRILSTVKEPRLVFNDDSERIMRMVRQAVSLGFDIDDKTLQSAKNNVFKFKFLQKSRLKQEFERIILADQSYPTIKNNQNAHVRGINLLAEIGILEFILPELQKIYNMTIYEDKGRLLFSHIMNVFTLCKEYDLNLRYSILMHDYGKAEALIKNGKFFGYKELGDSLIEIELGETGLCYNRKFINEVKNIINSIEFDKFGLYPTYKLRKFIFNNYMQIYNIILLKKYIFIDKNKKISLGVIRLMKEYNKSIDKDYPKNINDLSVSAKDIIQKFPKINTNKINELLNLLLDKCYFNYNNNNKKYLLKIISKVIKKNKNNFLEE